MNRRWVRGPAAGSASGLFASVRSSIRSERALPWQPAQDEAVEPRHEGGGVVRDFAVENLGLVEQQRRKVADIALARLLLRLGERLHQSVAHVELEDRLGAGAAVVAGEQPPPRTLRGQGRA